MLSHSITYRTALGPPAGQKTFTLQSLPGTPLPEPSKPFLAKADGFSLHAGATSGQSAREANSSCGQESTTDPAG